MIRRFQIEDLIAQDAGGVVFRAFDTETNKAVAIRRFFPFGSAGGGLKADEQSAYDLAVGKLISLSHPALRSVIGGGCDPVDGMPYLATEWIEGDPLRAFVAEGPLPADVAAELLAQALEVCEVLSHVLAKEAVWVETDLSTIIVGNQQSGRGFTFWISPVQWLGGHEKSGGLAAIVTLTETIMGWQERNLTDQAGHGLGGWLKWLRRHATTITLNEARETLAAAIGGDPPPPTQQLVVRASHPQAPRPQPPQSPRPQTRAVKRPPAKSLWVVNLLLILVTVGLAVWFLVRQHERQLARELAAIKLAATPAPLPAAERPDAGAIPWTSREQLLQKDHQPVVVEGVLRGLEFSNKKTVMYLLFSKQPDKNDARGVVAVNSAAEDLSEAALTPLIGKRIRLHGTVKVLQIKPAKITRPEISLLDRAAIELCE